MDVTERYGARALGAAPLYPDAPNLPQWTGDTIDGNREGLYAAD
jgi:hypothetical protein